MWSIKLIQISFSLSLSLSVYLYLIHMYLNRNKQVPEVREATLLFASTSIGNKISNELCYVKVFLFM
jgi:hypothetical protein